MCLGIALANLNIEKTTGAGLSLSKCILTLNDFNSVRILQKNKGKMQNR